MTSTTKQKIPHKLKKTARKFGSLLNEIRNFALRTALVCHHSEEQRLRFLLFSWPPRVARPLWKPHCWGECRRHIVVRSFRLLPCNSQEGFVGWNPLRDIIPIYIMSLQSMQTTPHLPLPCRLSLPCVVAGLFFHGMRHQKAMARLFWTIIIST